LTLGGDGSSKVYNLFKNMASDRFAETSIQENDKTSETIVDEHNVYDLITKFGRYADAHFAGSRRTHIHYTHLFQNFFNYLTCKPS
jgi:hypothetical protein